jgi:hypothetical protein
MFSQRDDTTNRASARLKDPLVFSTYFCCRKNVTESHT